MSQVPTASPPSSSATDGLLSHSFDPTSEGNTAPTRAPRSPSGVVEAGKALLGVGGKGKAVGIGSYERRRSSMNASEADATMCVNINGDANGEGQGAARESAYNANANTCSNAALLAQTTSPLLCPSSPSPSGEGEHAVREGEGGSLSRHHGHKGGSTAVHFAGGSSAQQQSYGATSDAARMCADTLHEDGKGAAAVNVAGDGAIHHGDSHESGGGGPHVVGRPRRHSTRGLRPSILVDVAEEEAVTHDARREYAEVGEDVVEAVHDQEIEIFVYSRRWIVLAIFVATLFINQAQYTAYVTIVDETRDFYDISAMQVNLLSIIYTAVNVAMIVFVCYFYDKVGFRNGVLLVGVTNTLCAGFKFISVFSPHYSWLVVGQIFGGCSQVLAISIPPLLAAIWFPLEERSVATAIGSVGGNLGVAFSFWASPLILNGSADKEHFLLLNSIYFGGAVLVMVLSFVLVHDQPPKPPSVTARTHETFGSSSFKELLLLFKKQLLNWSLVRLCFGFGVCVGLGTALSNVLAQIYKPYDVDGQSVGIIGAASIVASCATTPLFAAVLDKLRAYKPMLLGIYLLSGGVLGVLAGVMKADVPHFLPALYVLLILYQVVSQPSVPLMMEFSVEKTYPDPEFISSSFCLLTFSLFATLGGLAFSAMLGDEPTKEDGLWCIAGNAALAIVAVAVTATVSQERLRYEEEQRIYKSARVSQYNVGEMPKDAKKKSMR